MVITILRLFITFIGVSIGYGFFKLFEQLGLFLSPEKGKMIMIAASVLFGLIFFILSKKILNLVSAFIGKAEGWFEQFSGPDMLRISIGMLIGFITAFFISLTVNTIPYAGKFISIFIYIVLGYLGYKISSRRINDFSQISFPTITKQTKIKNMEYSSTPKILDTSAIIDGRIADVCKTGFVEGPLIIPEFILKELQHIADSSDTNKRNRGRLGLDMLKIIQKDLPVETIINYDEINDAQEVDIKLIKLAKKIGGKIITTDFNLNKIADLQEIEVLNVNELVNAIKTKLLPGEQLTVKVIKDGKEAGQGLAYLEDGTMIVVENGRENIGQTLETEVTSVLQTPAGRMIFVKPKNIID